MTDIDPSMRPSAWRFAAWMAIVVGVVYLTVAGGGGFFGLYNEAFRIASVGTITVVLLIWLAWAWRHPEWRPRTALWPALLACLVALVVSTAASNEPRFAYDFLAYSVLLTGAYLLLQRLFADPFFGQRLGALAAVLGIGLATIYLVAVARHWLDFWAVLGRFSVPPLRPNFEGLAYGNPSTVATVVMLLWLAAASHLGFSTRRKTLVLLILGLETALVVFLSGSRGAWAAIAISAVVLVPVWLADPDRRREAARLASTRGVRLIGAGGVIAAMALLIAFVPAVASRIGEAAADTRSAFLSASARMFLESPLTGLGPGTWTIERGSHTLASEADYYIPHAHNIFAQTLAELGIVGAAAGLVIGGAFVRFVARGARSPDPLQRRLSLAAIAASVYLGAHQLFDFYPNMPAVGFVLALTVARLDALQTKDAPAPAGRSFALVGGGLVIGILAGVGWLWRSEGAALEAVSASEALNRSDWLGATAHARSALELDSGMPPYLFTAGLATARLGDLVAARDYFRQAAEIDDFPTTWLDLAEVEMDLDNVDAARDAIRRAMRLGYQQPQVAVGAAFLLRRAGDDDAAVDALASALVVAPGLASDPYWATPDWYSLLDAAVDESLERASPSIGYRIALESGRQEEAARLAASISEDAGAVARLVVRAWSGDVTAFDELHARAISNPLAPAVVSICRRVAAHARDLGWNDSGAWACDGAGIPTDFQIVRISPPPESRVALPGPNASWHFKYTYRRVTPFDELVPGLPHLAGVIL
jgi:O-antigen ligase